MAGARAAWEVGMRSMRTMRTIGVALAACALMLGNAAPTSAAIARNWSVMPTPGPADATGVNSVSCASPTFCVIVGGASDGSTPFIDQWDGSEWTAMSLPTIDATLAILGHVSCVSETFCVAVGEVQSLGVYTTLIEMWNGSDWTPT